MGNRERVYKIKWSKHGERAEDTDLRVDADSYQDIGDFIDFGVYGDEGFGRTVRRVRASDVAQIKEQA
jgi:hypothetical protein